MSRKKDIAERNIPGGGMATSKTTKLLRTVTTKLSIVDKRVFAKEKAVLWLILLVYFVTMYGRDNLEIFSAAYARLEDLSQGRIMEFLFDWSWIPYGVCSQILFVLWVVPIKILSTIFGTALEHSIGAYLWYKLSMVLCFLVTVKETQKIAKTLDMDEERANWIGLFLMSSFFSVLPIFHWAQVDAIYMPVMMYGVRKYLEGDYKRFIIVFMLANSVKYLTIFVFLPLVLLKQKKVFHILRDFMAGLIWIFVEQIIKHMTMILYWLGVLSFDRIKEPSGLATSQIRALLFNTFSGPDSLTASVVVVAYGMICILAYCCHYESKKRAELTIWLAFSSIAVLFTFGTVHCYWIVLAAPFMILLLFMNRQNIRINFILEAIIPMSFIGVYVITQSQVFGGRATFDDLLFSLSGYLMNRRSSHSTNDVIHFIIGAFKYPGQFDTVIPAMAVLCMTVFMVINFPYFKCNTDGEVDFEEQAVWKSWYWFRISMLFSWFIFNFFCLFK